VLRRPETAYRLPAPLRTNPSRPDRRACDLFASNPPPALTAGTRPRRTNPVPCTPRPDGRHATSPLFYDHDGLSALSRFLAPELLLLNVTPRLEEGAPSQFAACHVALKQARTSASVPAASPADSPAG
jgi:hypothetical protein